MTSYYIKSVTNTDSVVTITIGDMNNENFSFVYTWNLATYIPMIPPVPGKNG